MNGYHLAGDRMPPFVPYPQSLLKAEITLAECLVYMLLLRRSFRSARDDKWIDGEGRVFLYYPIRELAAALGRSESGVKKALQGLESRDLIRRMRQGRGRPNRIYVKLPSELEVWEEVTDTTGVPVTDTAGVSGRDTTGAPGRYPAVTPRDIYRENKQDPEKGRESCAPARDGRSRPFLFSEREAKPGAPAAAPGAGAAGGGRLAALFRSAFSSPERAQRPCGKFTTPEASAIMDENDLRKETRP